MVQSGRRIKGHRKIHSNTAAGGPCRGVVVPAVDAGDQRLSRQLGHQKTCQPPGCHLMCLAIAPEPKLRFAVSDNQY